VEDQPKTILQPAPPSLKLSAWDGLTRKVAIESAS